MGKCRTWKRKAALSVLCLGLGACASKPVQSLPGLSYRTASASGAVVVDPMSIYTLTGDTGPVLDPSILKTGGTYYMFSTDVVGLPPGPSLPIRCSQDAVAWTPCGSVFPQIPGWVRQAVPGVVGLWAPDISYWGGLYHVYYSGSTLYSQRSVIGMATNVTLDPHDSRYQWIDHGQVLASTPGDDFNAIDPNILIDTDGSIRLTYGSYWSGIKQVEIDALSGMVKSGTVRQDLATRPGVDNNPIEGASMVRHNGFYYLFVSVDYCCNRDFATDNYKEAVGRSSTPQGPFVDMDGTPMMSGGGTIILDRDSAWNAPGGATAWIDPESGESLIVFHALSMSEQGASHAWVKHISWQNGWPTLQ